MRIIKINKNQLQIIKDLAYAVWPLAYGEILSKEQLKYMLEKFYSIEALESLWNEAKHVFYIAIDKKDKPLGFVSYELNCKPEKTKIHRIYVLPETQGTGLGKKLFYHVKEKALENNQKAIFLNVNKYNKAKFFYEKLGFEIVKEEVIDIGNNYVMDDYVMEVEI
ncbi:GNAT family N-acetyltransferase [Flavobacterium jejuense]|uniref:GNAT family N-acetyltransferase n=1 Tax=Flavobacterium jejuense TaxID=1544455 RepID=A0ABX0ING6_9FLAO|nr:GNAT family N-acetyltransferase [Flavobacterium jejuense]NHN25349.1 GNAT family N-acetyltransferase [Flavobacterium jejuense]